ncbi:MAG TPA: sodium:solute symporter family protein, partial [Noviherbaspirillum sp.]
LVTIAIGIYAATRVKNAGDFAVAGRSLPLYVVIATVFATWFGSETVLGIPATFLEEGLGGIIEDPFGASMCLVLVGLFFARKLYRMNLLTIGDYYRQRYGRTIEVVVSICIVLSYLGWVGAQITALGLVFNVLSQGTISTAQGMMIGAGVVMLYTLLGGMWSVALTDFFQMSIIVVGLLYITWLVSDMAGGADVVIQHAAANNKFDFFPALTMADILAFIAAWVTMMFGSIPQQDVFQRVMSAKSANVGAAGSVIGGTLYLAFAFIPIYLAYSAFVVDPQTVANLLEHDSQMILPSLVLNKVPVFAQVLFFGALLSAIMSTASGTLLAPSITLTHNLIGEIVPLSDRQLLFLTRVIVVCFGIAVTLFALAMEGTSIYEMVGNAYKVPLVGAFIPLVMGLYWSRATTQGAFFSTFGGLASWVLMEQFGGDSIWPAQLVGLLVAFFGMVLGSLLPQFVRPSVAVQA